MPFRRSPGISVLIATQNEEVMIETCIRSFLDFGDELIVVDNGSSDHTKDTVRALQVRHPKKIKFYDVPELPDLYHNRQYALEHSRYQWIVRADGDFVAYTDGEHDIVKFREHLLGRKWEIRPVAFGPPLPNLTGDLWHTGQEMEGGHADNPERKYVPPPVTKPTMRVYRHFPGFRFERRNRWEGVRFQRHIRFVELDFPLWMHCNIKSDLTYFYRSERTNWRELGDYQRFPTLRSFLAKVVQEKYGTEDIDEAARIYLERHFYPFLQLYDPKQHFPYPTLVLGQMEKNPVYRMKEEQGRRVRDFLGLKSGMGAAK